MLSGASFSGEIAMRRIVTLFFCTLLVGLVAAGNAAAASSPAAGYLANGLKRMERGDFAGAAIEFRNALQKDPKSGDAHYNLGLALLGLNDLDPVEHEFAAAAAAGHDPAEIESALARLLLRRARYAELVDTIKDGDRAAETEARIRMARGWAFFNLKQPDAAEREYADAIKLAPKRSEAETALAEARLAQDNLKGAAEMAEKAVADDPRFVQAWVLLGQLRELSGDRTAARQALDQAVTLAPNNASARVARARLVVDEDETLAVKDVTFVLDGIPNDPGANLIFALIKARHQDWAGADVALNRIRDLKEIPGALFLLADIDLAQGLLDQADSAIKLYLARAPNEPAAIAIRAAILIERGNQAGAVNVLKSALASHPDNAVLLGLLSDAYAKSGRLAEAAATLDRIPASSPQDEETRLRLAGQFLAVGRPEGALNELKFAGASAPLSVPVAMLATEAMLAVGKVDQSAAIAEDLIRQAPNDPARETLRGIVALSKENAAAARGHFEKALALDPDFAAAAIDLAQTYRLEKRLDDARAVFERTLARSPKNIALLMARADLEFAAGKSADAIVWLERARVADQRALAPLFRLVGAYLAQKNAAGAVAVARELYAIAPSNPQAVAALGEAMIASGDRTHAIAAFRRVVELTQQAPEALARLADVLVLDSKTAEANDLIRKAVATNPADAGLRQTLVALARSSNTVAATIGFARELGTRNPADPAVDELTGQLLEADSQYEAAAQAYAAGNAKAASSRLTLRRAQAQIRADALDAARATLADWLDKQPNDRAARVLLAELLARRNDVAGAIEEYERLVADKGTDPLALNELALLYQQKGDGRATATAEMAFAAAPRSPVIADTLGWILVQQGEIERGAALLRQAAAAPATAPTVRYHLAVALDDTGQRAEAKRLLDELLRTNAPFPEREAAEKLMAQLGG
jgi:putative PEP-CTERM system TPR-repeat lipoprotein